MGRSKALLAHVVLAGICVGFTCVPTAISCTAQTSDSVSAADQVLRMQQLVQSYVNSKVLSKTFMGSVLVVQGDRVLIDQGYGAADLEWGIPNAPDTKFRLASLTKQFTAASILLLEERGKLSTDDPVKKYVPDAPAAWDKITIYNLLTHTSGIPDFAEFPDYRATEWKETTPLELVARFKDKPLTFGPGTKYAYSNSGYVLLGFILEKVTNEPYAKFVQENLFEPLGMRDTGVDRNALVLPRRAQGYEAGADGIRHAGYIDMTIPFSAGDLYSTTGDLLKWEQGLFGGKVLSAASLKKMTTPFLDFYGCGLWAQKLSGHTVRNHSGGIEGYKTYLAYFPDKKDGPMTIVVLANMGKASVEIGEGLAKAVFGLPVQLAP